MWHAFVAQLINTRLNDAGRDLEVVEDLLAKHNMHRAAPFIGSDSQTMFENLQLGLRFRRLIIQPLGIPVNNRPVAGSESVLHRR